jgi:hypothetical protein
MAKLMSPVEDYNGFIGTVQFVNGQAETDDMAVIKYCRSAGYGFEDESDLPNTEVIPPATNVVGPLAETEQSTVKIVGEVAQTIPTHTEVVLPENVPDKPKKATKP